MNIVERAAKAQALRLPILETQLQELHFGAATAPGNLREPGGAFGQVEIDAVARDEDASRFGPLLVQQRAVEAARADVQPDQVAQVADAKRKVWHAQLDAVEPN